MTLVGTLVTVDAPSTVKLARSAPSKGIAHAAEGPQRVASTIGAAQVEKARFVIEFMVSVPGVGSKSASDAA
jgi:hypothetical protein